MQVVTSSGKIYSFDGVSLIEGEDYQQSKLLGVYDSSRYSTPRTFSLTLVNDCNLRCKYCYASQGAWDGRGQKMSLETAFQSVDLLASTMRMNRDSLLSLSFFININFMKNYTAITQLPYCCVATCIQMILYRRGLHILDQESIATELGLRIPEKVRKYFHNTDGRVKIVSDNSPNMGTQIFEEQYSIPNFFKKQEIPLDFSVQYFFDSPVELKEFLDAQSIEDDIMIRLHSSVLGDNPGIGHMVLFEGLENHMVYLADPLPPMLKAVTLQELWEGMNTSKDEVRRGLFLIKASSL
jgi:hypothetical protein